VIYGLHGEIEQSGNDYFAHKTGFTARSLYNFVGQGNFQVVVVCSRQRFEISAYAFCSRPKAKQLQMLGLPENIAN
jgi:hypothetical protein